MEKVTLQKQNLTPNFIGSWIMNPLSICDELITYFESNQNKQKRGIIAGGENLDSKNSIDITISPKEIKLPGNEVFEKYFHNLFSCYKDYVLQWPFLSVFPENLLRSAPQSLLCIPKFRLYSCRELVNRMENLREHGNPLSIPRFPGGVPALVFE